jgi:hypothetical protein
MLLQEISLHRSWQLATHDMDLFTVPCASHCHASTVSLNVMTAMTIEQVMFLARLC